MKIYQFVLLFAVASVEGANTRRLRRGVNARYMDLAGEIDETTMNRVARHQIHQDVVHEDRDLMERNLQSMSMSMSMRMRHLQEDMSMSMSMSM